MTLPFPKAPKHNRIKDTKARPMNAKEKRHADRVAAMGCLICDRPACVHHETGSPRQAKSHKRLLPLCPWDHTDGPEARHEIGYAAFCERAGFDLMEKAEELWAKSQEIENG